MRILLVNDDGYDALGIRALFEVLRMTHDVWIVAPDREVSGVAHAITLRQVVRLRIVGERIYAVEGSPTDCVNLALWHILPARPDLVVSGINAGWNLAEDITYSGTVAGAMEACIHKLRAIALSLDPDAATSEHVEWVARWFSETLPLLMDLPLKPRTFLNINWPRPPARGTRWTRLGTRLHPNYVIEREDPRGERYFWISRGEPAWEPGEDIDVHAVHAGFISITPVTVDWTDYTSLTHLRTFSPPDPTV